MFGTLFGRKDPTRTDLVDRARRMVDEGAILLDVRTPAEFAQQHVDGARNVPLQVIANRWRELGDKNTPIVVYCHSGGRSRSAARMLHDLDFRNVVDIGPMPNW